MLNIETMGIVSSKLLAISITLLFGDQDEHLISRLIGFSPEKE
jgi:hypothetical protein